MNFGGDTFLSMRGCLKIAQPWERGQDWGEGSEGSVVNTEGCAHSQGCAHAGSVQRLSTSLAPL